MLNLPFTILAGQPGRPGQGPLPLSQSAHAYTHTRPTAAAPRSTGLVPLGAAGGMGGSSGRPASMRTGRAGPSSRPAWSPIGPRRPRVRAHDRPGPDHHSRGPVHHDPSLRMPPSVLVAVFSLHVHLRLGGVLLVLQPALACHLAWGQGGRRKARGARAKNENAWVGHVGTGGLSAAPSRERATRRRTCTQSSSGASVPRPCTSPRTPRRRTPGGCCPMPGRSRQSPCARK